MDAVHWPLRRGHACAQQSHDDRICALTAHLRAIEEAEWSRRDIPQAGSLGNELRSRDVEAREVGGYSAPHSRGQGAAAATSVRAMAKVLGGRTLRAGPLKDVRRMEWRRWCAVVRRQWCEARRCYMAPTSAAASSKLLMAATQLRLVANPSMFNTHRSTTWLPESAKDEHLPLPAEIGRRAQVRRQPQRRKPRKDRRFKCAQQTSVSY